MGWGYGISKGIWKKQQLDFPGVNYKQHGISRGARKNHVEFLAEFPGDLVLGLKFSEGCNTILWYF